jgi:hypothetical protein
MAFQVPGAPLGTGLKVDGQGQIALADGSWETRREGSEVRVLQGQKLVASVKQKEAGRWDVSDAAGQRTAKVKLREDGDYKVTDSAEQMLVKLKKRDDGYKVVDSDEETVLIKVAAKDGRVKIKDGKEAELAKVKDTSNSLFLTWLSIEKLPLPVRLGMATITWSNTDG